MYSPEKQKTCDSIFTDSTILFAAHNTNGYQQENAFKLKYSDEQYTTDNYTENTIDTRSHDSMFLSCDSLLESEQVKSHTTKDETSLFDKWFLNDFQVNGTYADDLKNIQSPRSSISKSLCSPFIPTSTEISEPLISQNEGSGAGEEDSALVHQLNSILTSTPIVASAQNPYTLENAVTPNAVSIEAPHHLWLTEELANLTRSSRSANDIPTNLNNNVADVSRCASLSNGFLQNLQQFNDLGDSARRTCSRYNVTLPNSFPSSNVHINVTPMTSIACPMFYSQYKDLQLPATQWLMPTHTIAKISSHDASLLTLKSHKHYNSRRQTRSHENENEMLNCKIYDCMNRPRARGLCKRHGGGKRCDEPDCDRPAQCRSKCPKHGGASKCSIEGCTKFSQSYGKCKAHGGGTQCSFEGCTKNAHQSKLCRKHGGGLKCGHQGCKKWAQKSGHCCAHTKELHRQSNSVIQYTLRVLGE